MRTTVEINGLSRYLDGMSSEKAVQALQIFFSAGMQEVFMPERIGAENETKNNWRSELLRIKCAIASDPDVPLSLLKSLSRSAEPAVLERVAESPRADAHMLACLATSHYPEVRMAVADNQNTPLATLVVLAFDESADVRFRLAENHNIPKQVLEVLQSDENPYVSWRASVTFERLGSLMPETFWCAA